MLLPTFDKKKLKIMWMLLLVTHLGTSPLQPSLNDLHSSQMLVRTYNCNFIGQQPLCFLSEIASSSKEDVAESVTGT